MNIKEISSAKWIAVVNACAHPDKDYYELNYYKLGDNYIVHIASGYGSFISPMIPDGKKYKKELTEQTNILNQQYNAAKGKFSKVAGIMGSSF
jgi:hypothetical protein